MLNKLRPWAVPAGLLALLGMSFGLLIPQLGFYWDDWPVILTGRLFGAAGFWKFYQFDRPFSAWTYILTFPILGSSPISWQIFTLLLRWASSLALWWTLIRIWPTHRREVTGVAFLFAIYPVFTQQSISVAYSQHWLCYLLYFISLGLMVSAYLLPDRSQRWFWPITILAVIVSLLQLFTMEYFAGLELLRPFLLWILIAGKMAANRQRAAAVLRAWWPYLLSLAGFVVWRLFFLKFPGEEANPPVLLHKLLSSPIEASIRFLQIFAQDTIHLWLTVWSGILAATNIDFNSRFTIFSWGIAFLVALGAIVFFSKLYNNPDDQPLSTSWSWGKQALIVGAVAVALGMLPVWFTDRQIIVGAYSNRFGLPAMFGASLMVVALLEIFIGKQSQRIVLLSILIGLATGQHLRTANDYRLNWEKQTRFYWQLSWRAPAIQPGTALAADGEMFSYVGLYSTSAAINLIYPPDPSAQQLPYWFYSLGRSFKDDLADFQRGVPLRTDFRNYQFTGNTRDSILLFYNPGKHDCLEILDSQDQKAPDLPSITVEALQNARLDRILPGPTRPGLPPVDIFGPEPGHNWCYLYQKAALARQMGDWTKVTNLGDQAAAQGFTPKTSSSNTPIEWLPFIEGYARTSRWQEAQNLSLSAYARDKSIDARLCNLWDQLKTDLPASPSLDSSVKSVREALSCP